MKFWSHYLQYLKSHLEIFISHLAASVPLLQTNTISLEPCLSIYFLDMACFDGFVPGKRYKPNINIQFGPNGAQLSVL